MVSCCKALQDWHRPFLVTAGGVCASLSFWESSSCLLLEVSNQDELHHHVLGSSWGIPNHLGCVTLECVTLNMSL